MKQKEYAMKLEKYLIELRETLIPTDQVHAWGYGALTFAKRINAISIEDYTRLMLEHNARFRKDDWNDSI